MSNQLLLRRRTICKSTLPPIYKLYNHVCEGNAATCINTGIKLFSNEFMEQHPKIQIIISYTPSQVASNNGNHAHILRCNRSQTPYNGFWLRYTTTSPYPNCYCVRCRLTNTEEENVINVSTSDDKLLPVVNLIIELEFNSGTIVYTIKNRNSGLADYTGNTTIDTRYDVSNIPFVIGGSLVNGVDTSGGWNEMWKGTIQKLIIRDLP